MGMKTLFVRVLGVDFHRSLEFEIFDIIERTKYVIEKISGVFLNIMIA